MIKYNHAELAETLLRKYQERFPGNQYARKPMGTIQNVISCIDDCFMDEWRRDVQDLDAALQREILDTEKKASDTLLEFQAKIDDAKREAKAAKTEGITNKYLLEALAAYKSIVTMNFDTPQQKLQNIQNASYFIWALYSGEGKNSTMFMRKDLVSDVKEESDYNPHEHEKYEYI